MLYKKSVSLSCFLLAISLATPSLFAQGSQHTETWTFGDKCRMTFENGVVTSSEDPIINVSEGSASFSDPGTGELIAYSDGTSLWQKNGDVVVADLLGGPSVLHGVVIVPRPLSANRIYTISHTFEESKSISTREFDVSDPDNIAVVGLNNPIDLDGGADTAREGMIVVPHANGRDFWVIISGDKALFVVPVTSAGLGTPVKYNTDIDGGSFGLFAMSNSGTTLVMSESDAMENLGGIFSLTFDPADGTFASAVAGTADQTLIANNLDLAKYGGTFSPDDTKLYYSTLGVNNAVPEVPSSLWQFDFDTQTNTLIDKKPVGYYHSEAKLAQNGKVYISSGFSDDSILSVIDNPNDVAADITLATVTLDPGCDPVLGLPQTISPVATVSLGIEINQPDSIIDGSVTTPSGTANMPDGTELTITISGGEGEQTCKATVENGRWACPADSITGLVAGVDYTIVASDGENSTTGTFKVGDCKAGQACDVNECELMTDKCDSDATCTDTLNGYSCECNAPKVGDGFTCSTPGTLLPDAGPGADMGTGTPTPEPQQGQDILTGGSTCSSISASSAPLWFLALAFFGFRTRKKSV